MKIYCGKNKHGIWKASLDESKLHNFDNIFESEVEKINNDKVYLITTYYGFDYNFGSKTQSIHDVVKTVHQAYHSVLAAKKSDIWKEREKIAKETPDKFHVTPVSIASDDYGEPFTYGDVMDDKFNMRIIGVKVI